MRLSCCLFALILFAAASQALAADRITIARNGSAVCAISLGDSATPTEKTAALELGSYLSEITGAEFVVIPPSKIDGAPVIAIGPEAARAVAPGIDLDRAKLGDDGIVILTVGSNLLLTGAIGSRRGTLYAVYQFLEQYIGVRWWTSTETSLPKQATLHISSINKRYVPPITYRSILYRDVVGGTGSGNQMASDPAHMRFAVRMKLNGDFHTIAPEWGGQYTIVGWCHHSFALMPPEKYFKDHPEWYSEIDGKRVWERGQLCCTNEDMIAELTKNVIALVKQNPDAKMIDVSQNDWIGNCQCANCRKIDEAEGSPAGSILYAINKVAEAVDKVDPEYKVEFIAYQYSRKAPKTVRPRKNVIVRVCVIERSCTQPIDSKINAALLQDLRDWSAIAPNLMVWDYTDQLSCSLKIHPNVAVLAPDFKTYALNNAKGVFCEGDDYTIPIGDDELKHYVMAHALWNPAVRTKKLIDEFVKGYYGPAAPMIRKYVNIQTARTANARTGWSCDQFTLEGTDAKWLSLADMNTITRLFNEAQRRVKDDPVLLARVKRMRLQVDNQWVAGFNRYSRESVLRKQEFLGPADPVKALDQLVVDARSFGVSGLQWAGVVDLTTYANGLRPLLKVYTGPSSRPSALLPAPFDKLPKNSFVEVQDENLDLFYVGRGDSSWVDDPLASDGRAAFLNPKFANWAVQVTNPEKWGVKVRWRAYAIVRVEKIKEKGLAFVGGIWNPAGNKSDHDVLVQLSPSDRPPSSPTLTAAPLDPAADVRDGQYHIYDLGAHDFSKDGRYLWLGTTHGFNPEDVKGIWVDRVFFVKGK